MDHISRVSSRLDIIKFAFSFCRHCIHIFALSNITVVAIPCNYALWQVTFPFHVLSFEKAGKNKYIHITCIIFGILLPQVPIITIIADFAVNLHKQNENSTSQHLNGSFLSGRLDFGPIGYPTTLCRGSDKDTVLYSIAMLISIVMAVGCSLLIIIFFSVHKAHIKRKKMQVTKHSTSLISYCDNMFLFNVARSHQWKKITFGRAEKKLFIVFVYYVVMTLTALAQFSYSSKKFTPNFDDFQNYSICEQRGHNLSNPCSGSGVVSDTYMLVKLLHRILRSMFPLLNLIYIVNIQELKILWT